MRVVGLGLSSAATERSVAELMSRLEGHRAEVVAVPQWLKDHPAIVPTLRSGIPVRFISEAALNGVPSVTFSARIHDKYGTGSVAEACALVAAGSAAEIIVPRLTSSDRFATGAIADLVERTRL